MYFLVALNAQFQDFNRAVFMKHAEIIYFTISSILHSDALFHRHAA
jgi:hypothetical protein